MKCTGLDHRSCDNDARYALVTGELMCGLCSLKSGTTHVRISDTPFLRLVFENQRRQLDRAEVGARREIEDAVQKYFRSRT